MVRNTPNKICTSPSEKKEELRIRLITGSKAIGVFRILALPEKKKVFKIQKGSIIQNLCHDKELTQPGTEYRVINVISATEKPRRLPVIVVALIDED